ncbi:hypothetical protein ZIOFF_001710 [Zingiber officinale]|uniref:Uncharacterized protein n=1 Tax=Zingiber officinale TaxID=94328 RepID=A0A8J5HZ03_ZINOF|nr:hypothetical protein ZIOFF_001710 [Zingiber officinale]
MGACAIYPTVEDGVGEQGGDLGLALDETRWRSTMSSFALLHSSPPPFFSLRHDTMNLPRGFAWEGKRCQLVAVWGSPVAVASPFEIAGPTSTSLSSCLSEVNPMVTSMDSDPLASCNSLIRSILEIKVFNYSLKENKDILTGWEDVIAGIDKSLIKEKIPKQYAHVLSMVLVVTNYDITSDASADKKWSGQKLSARVTHFNSWVSASVTTPQVGLISPAPTFVSAWAKPSTSTNDK